MKKILSIFVIISLLMGFTACTREPDTYISNDFSYLVFDGERYERLDLPFDISCDNTMNSSQYKSLIYFKDANLTTNYLYTYNVAKRAPFVWISDLNYDLYDVKLSDGINLKMVTTNLEAKYLYVSPEEKKICEEKFNNIIFPSSNGYAVIELDFKEASSIGLSTELVEYILNKRSEFNEYMAQNENIFIRFNPDDEMLSGYIEENCYVFLYDTDCNFKQALFELVYTPRGVMLIDPRVMIIYSSFKNDEKKRYTPVSEFEHLFLPDKFDAELSPIIDEMIRIREQRLSKA